MCFSFSQPQIFRLGVSDDIGGGGLSDADSSSFLGLFDDGSGNQCFGDEKEMDFILSDLENEDLEIYAGPEWAGLVSLGTESPVLLAQDSSGSTFHYNGDSDVERSQGLPRNSNPGSPKISAMTLRTADGELDPRLPKSNVFSSPALKSLSDDDKDSSSDAYASNKNVATSLTSTIATPSASMMPLSFSSTTSLSNSVTTHGLGLTETDFESNNQFYDEKITVKEEMEEKTELQKKSTAPIDEDEEKTDYDSIKRVCIEGPWPSTESVFAEDLWRDKPVVIVVVRRLGCPFCRMPMKKLVEMKPEFDKIGVQLVAIASQPIGALEFKRDVWGSCPLYIDFFDGFKKGMGYRKYQNWWLFKPQVALNAVPYYLKTGMYNGDMNEKSKARGGELVVSSKGIIFEYREDTSFGHSAAEKLLEESKRALKDLE